MSSLASGTRLGAFEILSLLGSGGMGEVYRARDTVLKREVALKVLPEAFARDAERVARFTREAEVLASLNHPHVAQIYGVAEGEGLHAIVMELVEGEDLALRVARGAIPLGDALPLAGQIAEALEAAHDQGIVHRDLKPGNIKVRPDGTVKVLDFGLAKAMDPAGGAGQAGGAGAEIADSPTITSPAATMRGVILGTAAYMSPEQARGKPVDRRADIWAFGGVLFEMLTGRRAFTGETVTDVLAAVVDKEPDWSALPAATPASVTLLLRRCLAKDLALRLPHIGAARLELLDAIAGRHAALTTSKARPHRSRRSVFAGAGAALLLLAGGIATWRAIAPRPEAPAPVVRFEFDVPLDRIATMGSAVNRPLAVSPDGSRLVYFAGNQLYVRTLDRGDATPVAGTEGAVTASHPFFSPDGQWLAFFRDGSLVKVPVAGGPPTVICAADVWGGGSWGVDDQIVFSQRGGIFRVSSSGGAAERLAVIDDAKGEEARQPQVLPGGSSVIYSLRTRPGPWSQGAIVVQSLGSTDRQVVVEGGMEPRYLQTGQLIFGRDASVYAVPFDAALPGVTGDPVRLAGDVPMQQTTTATSGFLGQRQLVSGWAAFSVSDSALLYVPSARASSLVWVDRRGNVTPSGDQVSGTYHTVQLSPEGRRAVGDFPSAVGGGTWVHDLQRRTRTLLTRSSATLPTWRPDGTHVTFIPQGPSGNVVEKAADGVGDERAVLVPGRDFTEPAWSPDGHHLVVTTTSTETAADIWVASRGGTPRLLVGTPAEERAARFSPDSRYLAYQSDESGRLEIYVQPFPGPGARVLVSTGGGTAPVWSRDGSELYYHEGTALMAVPVRTKPTFTAGAPARLFDVPVVIDGTGHAAYDVSPDGRFLMIQVKPQTSIKVVLNWAQELKSRAGDAAR